MRHSGRRAKSSGGTHEWISADTIRRLETKKERKIELNTGWTRADKSKGQAEYTAADREVKRIIRKDKRDYWAVKQRKQQVRVILKTCT